jgi:sulfite exporter TauE/SafE
LGTIDYITIISIAFFGSIGHCSGMCGGLVVAYTSSKIDNKWGKSYQALAHFLHNIGRVTTYTIFGFLFGAIGSVVSVGMFGKGILFIFLAIIMILMGLSFLGKSNFLTSIEIGISSSNSFKKVFISLLSKKTLSSFYLLGILNGAIPCGFVYFFLAGAVATSSPLLGGLVMFLFGIATIPTLFTIGMVVGFLNSGKFKNFMIKVAGVTIILYGLFMGYKGVMLVNGKMPMKHNKIMENPIEKAVTKS